MVELEDLIRRLEALESDLGDFAIQKLRDSLEGDSDAANEEKRITRARRAVEKAAGLLAGLPLGDEI